jgi:hypothetical protein
MLPAFPGVPATLSALGLTAARIDPSNDSSPRPSAFRFSCASIGRPSNGPFSPAEAGVEPLAVPEVVAAAAFTVELGPELAELTSAPVSLSVEFLSAVGTAAVFVFSAATVIAETLSRCLPSS